MALALIAAAALGGLALLRSRAALPPDVRREADGSLTTMQNDGQSVAVSVRHPAGGEAGESSPAAAGLILYPSILAGIAPPPSKIKALTDKEQHQRAKRILHALNAARKYILAQPDYHGPVKENRHWKRRVKRLFNSRINGEIRPILGAGDVPTDQQVEQIVLDALATAYQPWGAEHSAPALSVMWERFG